MTISHRTLYESLNSHSVRYLVIGGTAAIGYGIMRSTEDLDLLIEGSLDNARALLQALRDLGMGTAFLVEPEELLGKEVTAFVDVMRVDVLTAAPGISFEEAWRRRTAGEFQGVLINLASIEDLIASKEASGRPRDLEDAATLRRIVAEQADSGDASLHCC